MDLATKRGAGDQNLQINGDSDRELVENAKYFPGLGNIYQKCPLKLQGASSFSYYVPDGT
jgi:hypothetical protein